MEIICQTCKSKLKVPDEKIPKDRDITVICPTCKGTISIEAKTDEKENQRGTDFGPQKLVSAVDHAKQTPSDTKTDIPTIEMSMEELIDFIEEEERRALICDDDKSHQDNLRLALKELGYRAAIGNDPKDVLEKIRFEHFDVIIIHDTFGSWLLSDNSVLNFIQPMPIATRRDIFVALIGNEYKTFDNMMAFSKSVNLVVNENDLSTIKPILKKAISENDKFYKIFKETLSSSGKA